MPQIRFESRFCLGVQSPNNNDPAHFKETGVYIETFFGEITHQYTSEVLTSLPKRDEHKRVPLGSAAPN